MDEIVKEDNPIIKEESSAINIVSDNELKEVFVKLTKTLEDQRQESLEMYNILKDMVLNSGDFDSSQATKEALSNLLANSQDAIDGQIKLFETIYRSKSKISIIQTGKQQNNIFLGANRRDLLKALEQAKETPDDVNLEAKEIKNTPEKKEEIINTNEQEFEIKSGDIIK